MGVGNAERYRPYHKEIRGARGFEERMPQNWTVE
jgi:hypothetical protein